MKIWVGVTDRNWFEHLVQLRPDEVNFWQPSGTRTFQALQPGEPFLFKLHRPDHFIVGGGIFVRSSLLPASLAWDAFEQKNGVKSFDELRARIRRYRRDNLSVDPVIGCNILTEPFFLSRDAWIAAPGDWAPNIVQGKTYDAQSTEGQRLWEFVRQQMSPVTELHDAAADAHEGNQSRFGAEYLIRGRLGQGAFRVIVTDAYQRRCAVTGERTLPVLEAAHIKPYALSGPNAVSNGILLRSDLHKLFDLGYLTVTPDLRLEVSSRLREDWQNGREYYAHHGRELSYRPTDATLLPGRQFLLWHNENVFKA
jgi:putative restriction endonuclease